MSEYRIGFAAELLGVSPDTVRRLADNDELVTRSDQSPDHHATSSADENVQTPAVEARTGSPASFAQLFNRRPASGSAPLPCATSR